ncbi:MAG: hypothetical protein K8R53_16335 [Bacteroidales bacterium]|nr:hypothetical protein [Bacteroidales bacterium]
MKTIFILSVIVGTLTFSLFGQNIELTFAGDNNGQSVQLDSVCIENLTQGGEVVLYPPDLILILVITGINDGITPTNNAFVLKQNYPNPCNDQTSIQLQMTESADVEIVVSNLLGQNILGFNKTLRKGGHTFTFTPGNEPCYLLTANCLGQSKTIKMLCYPGNVKQAISLTHTGYTASDPAFKISELLWDIPYNIGDELLMIGYSADDESGMVKSPEVSQEYILQFATNVTCPGLDSLLYEGQWYHTIQVGGQCWLKENMNVGEMISGNQTQTNNGTIEKYCYANSTAKCDELGGLYIWDELMQYSTEQRARGICPEGWHIPTDEEFKVLEGMVDSNFPIGHPVWNQGDWRGFDAAIILNPLQGG